MKVKVKKRCYQRIGGSVFNAGDVLDWPDDEPLTPNIREYTGRVDAAVPVKEEKGEKPRVALRKKKKKKKKKKKIKK